MGKILRSGKGDGLVLFYLHYTWYASIVTIQCHADWIMCVSIFFYEYAKIVRMTDRSFENGKEKEKKKKATTIHLCKW